LATLYLSASIAEEYDLALCWLIFYLAIVG